MSFTPGWSDGSAGATPLDAAQLNSEELRVFNSAVGAAAQAAASLATFNVINYGARGDGVTDDTVSVQAALNAAATNGGIVDFPVGSYLCNDLTLSGNTTVQGRGWRSIIKQKLQAGDNHFLLSVNPGSAGTVSYANNTTGVHVRDIQLLGTVVADGFMQHVHLLDLNSCSDSSIQRVFFNGFRGDGLYLSGGNSAGQERHNRNIRVLNCLFDGINNQNRNCISVIDGDGIEIGDSWFRNSTEAGMPGAIDLEVNQAYSVIKDITIRDNVFENIGGAGSGVIGMFNIYTQATLTTPTTGLKIRGNTIRNCPNSPLGIQLQQQQQTSLTVQPNDITITDNKVDGMNQAVELEGVRGVKVYENTFSNLVNSAVQLGYTYKCSDITIHHNTLRTVGTGATVNEGIGIFRADRTTIHNNNFDSVGLANGTYGILLHLNQDAATTGASDTIEFYNNEVTGTTATNVTIKAGGHAIASVSRNRAYNNRFGGLAADATIFTRAAIALTGASAWNPGAIANGASVNTTVTVPGGAVVGEPAYAGHSGLTVTGWSIQAVVSATNTVLVTLTNNTGGSLTPTGTVTATVLHVTT